jgi:hypothetical protein
MPISGQHTFTHHPLDGYEYSGMPIDEAIQTLVGKALSPETTEFVAGVKVCFDFTKDAYRVIYNIPTNDGPADPAPSDEQIAQRAAQHVAAYNAKITAEALAAGKKPPKEFMVGEGQLIAARDEIRTENVAVALRDFVRDNGAEPVKNENAAFVLSSVMLQQIVTKLQSVVYDPTLPFTALALRTARNMDGQARPLTIKDSSGQTHPVVPTGIGGVLYNLSKDGDNFKIAFDYPTYAEAKYKKGHEFPLHQDGVIGIHFKAEIIVDGNEAREGRLKLTMPEGVQVEYSGRFKLD